MNLLAKYDEASTNMSPEDLTNILNDSIPVKHSRSFTKDSLISKPPKKRAVKSMYFYSFILTILLEYGVDFDLYFTYNSRKKYSINIFALRCRIWEHLSICLSVIMI